MFQSITEPQQPLNQKECNQLQRQAWRAVKFGVAEKKQYKEKDEKAVRILLNLVKENWEKLYDSKTVKKDVWGSIARDMENEGWNLGDTPTLKVDRKWRNLWSAYKSYVKNLEANTGAGIEMLEDAPPFIEEIREIVGHAHSVHPTFVADACGYDPKEFSSSSFTKKRKKRHYIRCFTL